MNLTELHKNYGTQNKFKRDSKNKIKKCNFTWKTMSNI